MGHLSKCLYILVLTHLELKQLNLSYVENDSIEDARSNHPILPDEVLQAFLGCRNSTENLEIGSAMNLNNAQFAESLNSTQANCSGGVRCTSGLNISNSTIGNRFYA